MNQICAFASWINIRLHPFTWPGNLLKIFSQFFCLKNTSTEPFNFNHLKVKTHAEYNISKHSKGQVLLFWRHCLTRSKLPRMHFIANQPHNNCALYYFYFQISIVNIRDNSIWPLQLSANQCTQNVQEAFHISFLQLYGLFAVLYTKQAHPT
jgi:hypothetical protein